MINNTLGFFKDERCLKLAEIFSNGIKIKEIYIDIYSNNPFDNTVSSTLMLRCNENNILIDNDGNNIIIKKNDMYNTHIAKLSLTNIKDCYYQVNNNNLNFILNYLNTYYKVTIFK